MSAAGAAHARVPAVALCCTSFSNTSAKLWSKYYFFVRWRRNASGDADARLTDRSDEPSATQSQHQASGVGQHAPCYNCTPPCS